jgi:hypothetical protein
LSAQLAPSIIFQAFAQNGSFLVGGQLFTYAAGTTNPLATYVDTTQTTQNTNPVILNASGQASVYLDPKLSYKFVLQDASGNSVPPGTVDNIPGFLSATSLVLGTPGAGTSTLVVNGNSTDTALVVNTTLAAGVAVQVNGNVNQALAVQLVNPNTGNHAGADFTCGDASGNAGFLNYQGVNAVATVTGGIAGFAVNVGSFGPIPLQICTNNTVRAGVNGTTGAWTFTSAVGLNGNLTVGGNLTVTGTAATGALTVTGAATASGIITSASAVALSAGGTTTCGILASATAGLGIFFGTGPPTLNAAEGSIYSNTTGSAGARLYCNTSSGSGTTWTALTTP